MAEAPAQDRTPRSGQPSGLTRTEIAILAALAAVTVVAGITRYAEGVSRIVAFVFATLALAGMAWVVALATEQVGERLGPAVTGLMQSTVGNLPEFFVVIFALQAGELVVAETAILGSILVNALLVLGLVIMAGARREGDGVMRFNPRLPNDTATLLLVVLVHHRADRAVALGQRHGQPSHQDDLDHRRGGDPDRLRHLVAAVPDLAAKHRPAI